ncbi:MAG TPA: M23 family metallopeptidase [Xanthomonadaceae bacterium]|jgi:murein DD-endopeptidase MepM/ murein hydrolase activator NlpD|nr:M23 family metallopeptidase [Xanthomonadaceae bacterium]
MKKALATLLVLACSACATEPPQQSSPQNADRAHEQVTAAPKPATQANGIAIEKVPTSVPQAGLLMGAVPPGSALNYDGRAIRIAANGRFVLGVAREQTGSLVLNLTTPDGNSRKLVIAITPRTFPVERVNGVPEKTVNPPPDIAARIEREQAEVNAARVRDDDRTDFDTTFIWPVKGRISGVFGSQRVYNGTPASPHSGVDIAAAKGTPIHAPAGGIVTFANPDLYLTGGTVVVDHGHGVSSNFLHMSRIDVKVGDRVEQGQVIGLVGATGRATGPHMHWGMNWFNVRVDPQLLMPPGDAK